MHCYVALQKGFRMPDLPLWLEDALATQAATHPVASPLAPAASVPARGDLRPLVSMDVRGPTPRIVLVMDLDPDARFATIALTSNEMDLATEDDALVSAELSSAPFDLLVELDLQGTARSCQLGRKLGHIDIAVLRDRDLVPRGLPVRSADDERADFKNAELETLYALVGEAMRAVEAPDECILSFCDPDAIRLLARTDPSMLGELVVEGSAALPGWVAEQLLIEADGHDELVLLDALFQGSLETRTPYRAESNAVTEWHPAAEPAAHELLEASIAAALSPEIGEVRLATVRSLWRSESDAPSFLELRSRRVQLDLDYVGVA